MEVHSKKRKHSTSTDSDELNQDYDQPVEEPETAEEFFETVINELLLNLCFRAKFNAIYMPEELEDEEEPMIVIPSNDQLDAIVTCRECKRLVATSKFTAHLERCMNLGRNSRNAKKKPSSESTYVEKPWRKPRNNKSKKSKKTTKKNRKH